MLPFQNPTTWLGSICVFHPIHSYSNTTSILNSPFFLAFLMPPTSAITIQVHLQTIPASSSFSFFSSFSSFFLTSPFLSVPFCHRHSSFPPITSLSIPKPLHVASVSLQPQPPSPPPQVAVDPHLIVDAPVVQRLSSLIAQRAHARWHGRYPEADALKQQVLQVAAQELPPGFQLAWQDRPRKQGGGTHWMVLVQLEHDDDNNNNNNIHTAGGNTKTKQDQLLLQAQQERDPTVLQLAHAALAMAVHCSQQAVNVPEDRIQVLVDQAKSQLHQWSVVHADLCIHHHAHDIPSNPTFHPATNMITRIDAPTKQQPESTAVRITTTTPAPKKTTTTSLSPSLILSSPPPSSATSSSIPPTPLVVHISASTTFDLLNGWLLVERSLRGRKAADAAFWFALAGVHDTQLFLMLADVCAKELQRFGSKKSCRVVDILQVAERLAAAGVSHHTYFQTEAFRCMETKSHSENDPHNSTHSAHTSDYDPATASLVELRRHNLLDLHSERSLLMLWKFSSSQQKQQPFVRSPAANHTITGPGSGPPVDNDADKSEKYSWQSVFSDPKRPLVIDIGCGMGISMLGLATLCTRMAISDTDTDTNTVTGTRFTDFDHLCSADLQSIFHFVDNLKDCNFVGVDLSGLAIGYATGLATRWGLTDRLLFVVDSAEHALDKILSTYPGPVSLCLVQFPTPYRMSTPANDDHDMARGNSQLPSSPWEGFMFSMKLLLQIRQVLKQSDGKLLLQSNCEDVAVWMRSLACRENMFYPVRFNKEVSLDTFDSIGASASASSSATILSSYPSPSSSSSLSPSTSSSSSLLRGLPQRTLNWIAQGGARAAGPGWTALPLLPARAATETEIACQLNGVPVHRCLLSVGQGPVVQVVPQSESEPDTSTPR